MSKNQNVIVRRAFENAEEYFIHQGPKDIQAFYNAGWEPGLFKDFKNDFSRLSIYFSTNTGVRVRFLDGKGNKYQHAKGYKKCWYRLDEAIALAKSTNQSLVIVNGEASVIVAQSWGLAATTVTAGEMAIPADLLDELVAKYRGPIIVAGDSDDLREGQLVPAGKRAALQRVLQLRQRGIEAYAVDFDRSGGYDAANFAKEHGDNTVQAFNALEYAPQDDYVLLQKEQREATAVLSSDYKIDKNENPSYRLTLEAAKEALKENFLSHLDEYYPHIDYEFVGNEVRLLGYGGTLVNLDDVVFYRHSAGYGGDCLDLIAWLESEDKELTCEDLRHSSWFGVAKKKLEEMTGIPIPSRFLKPLSLLRSGNIPIVEQSTDEAPDIAQELITKTASDAGHAERLQLLFGRNIRFNHSLGKWLLWDGIRWKVDTKDYIQQIAIEVARQTQKAVINGIEKPEEKLAAVKWAILMENVDKRRDMLLTARSMPEIATTSDDFDKNPMLLGVQNGVIDLVTCEFLESKREDHISRVAGTHYDPTATCPRWERFLSEIYSGDMEIVRYVQRAIGYTLTGDTREQVFFLNVGHGSNGKSTVFQTLYSLLGEYAETLNANSIDDSRKSEQTNDIAKLKGARFVGIVETKQNMVLDEGRIKSLTGGDTITARFLNKEFFDFEPEFKLWVAVNYKPTVREERDGIWRRIQVLPYKESFLGKEDKTLSTTLQGELAGILNWALEGLKEWHRIGLDTPAVIKKEAAEYRKESDTLALWFEDECIIDETAIVITDTAYNSYKDWAMANGCDYIMEKKKLTIKLKERGFDSIVKRVGFSKDVKRVYKGFTVNK